MRNLNLSNASGCTRLQPAATPEMVQRLFALRREFIGRPYEESLLELFSSVYDGAFGKNKSDLKSLFCSELVAEGDMRMGILDPHLDPSNEYTPEDYNQGGRVDHLMKDGVFHYGDLIDLVG